MGLSLEVPLTQVDIADLTGVSMVHVSRVFTQLRADGLAQWNRNLITVLKLDGLRAFSGLTPRQLRRDHAWLPATR